MSGGSRNYLYWKIESEYVGKMYDSEINELVNDIAKLFHDVEWYESGDYSEETYRESVREFKKKWFNVSRDEMVQRTIEKETKELELRLKKELM